MTEQLAKLLAETDDPQAIKELLEYADNDQTTPPSAQDRATLQELCERFVSRRQDRSPATRAQYKRTIPPFIAFATSHEVTTPAGISPDLLDQYIDALQATHDSDATILTHTKNVRGWLRWLNKRGHCPERVYRILDKDELGLEPSARDEALPTTVANTILERLRQQRQGSLKHAVLELLWNAALRIGGLHSLDLQDFDPENNELRVRHRPEQGTRLKNGSQNHGRGGDGERNILLDDAATRTLDLYTQYERTDITEPHGRDPLFTTSQGRASQSTLRRTVYEATSCRWHPTDPDPPDCNGDCDPDAAVCPYSYYPHAIRRGAIVHHLSGGLRPDLASQRFDVSIQTLEKHYDPRSKRRRRKDRADSVRDAW
ncbi:tyrosine-type recombinase/integrase [Halobacterium jilantaiense]|uniref:Phage integrase, N-terminal SAM-like domain n=1 Tax=Halobacterium jilantaiense TaxID=355548 RepID=A0A1I0NHT7_9EURY|nr:tyrosine-type recombinase/integrase [Halobacterium jilantaiense]SEW00741.1 Phage integrase, N-terminal SAM-like domain [Halobacterium jilantaiense]